MKPRFLTIAFVALALVCAACGDNDKTSSQTTIGTDDAPAPAGPAGPVAPSSQTPGVSGREIPLSWPAPTRDVKALIAKAGLPALPGERLEYHLHSHIDIFVNGKASPVPANLGIDLVERVLSPLHTHDETGIIHVENEAPATFYLGQLFTEWDIRLDVTCIGSYCRPETEWAIYVDGTKDTRDPANIEFAKHRQITIVIGTPPKDIPDDYKFPEGL